MKKVYKFLYVIIGTLMFASCHNQDISFPDYEFSSVYFARQTPVRTLVMGEDTYDTSMDNEHKCRIYATMGGVYENNKRVKVGIEVDKSLCDNLYFDDKYSKKVHVLPDEYYTLSDDKILLDNQLMGAVEVSFTDEFFNDPMSLENNYVIPLRMTYKENADSILCGVRNIDNADWTDNEKWSVLPKNYVLYCVKYINAWEGNYLRRGKDIISKGGEEIIFSRKEEYVEDDELCEIYTKNLNTSILPMKSVHMGDFNLVLTFDDENKCSVDVENPGFSVSPESKGEFVIKGDKNSWGNKDRNVLYLDYTITNIDGTVCHTMDTLVVRDRGVAYETFSSYYKHN